MPFDVQSKMLRFLESGQIRKMGSTHDRLVDVRLIAATNRERTKMEAGDGFRSDLYYRLAHAIFTLPPLRERGRDDIELLADHFLSEFGEKHRKSIRMSAAARDRLVEFPWPGNIRQLRGVMQWLVVQSVEGHVVTPRDLPIDVRSSGPRTFSEEIEDQEKRRIVEALEKTHYIKAEAARMLRMSRTTLIGKMKRFGVSG